MSSSLANQPLGPPDPHQCGRCRLAFAGDPSLTQGIAGDWWACGPCRASLLGSTR